MKKLAILGAGESGMGAAILARVHEYPVFVSDSGVISSEKKQKLKEIGADYEDGGHSKEKILAFDEIIKSPGIPYSNEVVEAALEKGISVIDELEFAYRYSKGKVIAITGTNGKTTTTLLTYHLMKTAGMDVGLGGNVGKSWARQLAEKDHEWWVLEVSSFQIDGLKTFRPRVAVVTNITADHLDRYGYVLDKYIHSKLNLLNNMLEGDAFIYYQEDHNIWKGLSELLVKPQIHEVSLEKIVKNGSFYNGSEVKVNFGDKIVTIPEEEIVLRGTHNMINVMCAVNAALIAGADEAGIKAGLKDFKNAPHRMEIVDEIDGVLYINDSKGTNVDASSYALAAFQQPMVWIAGGVDKGNDYEALKPEVIDHVIALICLGKENDKLIKAFEKVVPEIRETKDMTEAVKWGQELTQDGEVVLLSPACASFDLFKNYVDRGDQFKAAVKNLKSKEKW
ncbi:UDP-N-acetylmuramoyl-L-alanine--D-glutamate ligase [Echinicola jeungdonensis]|uniref:UDP-N-acetylmuramoylalanine--D-glutamate ligase n=1 Tax=Echinicola jeungdonensis TaxID=709343 RepID=A0ABV5J172_9BACT|nr:UDP-N-acetylmuramoyl-L-alanine--D-glutamate ligase [Echinicola jeungdonensis]MDN3668406.1 UDP-N-acetylmuramoyl-L-alanine--D-glutamate ligase [Echinicola jeungdonensis]